MNFQDEIINYLYLTNLLYYMLYRHYKLKNKVNNLVNFNISDVKIQL